MSDIEMGGAYARGYGEPRTMDNIQLRTADHRQNAYAAAYGAEPIFDIIETDARWICPHKPKFEHILFARVRS